MSFQVPKFFPTPQQLGSTGMPNSVVQQAKAPDQLPLNTLLPLLPNVPTVTSPNNMPVPDATDAQDKQKRYIDPRTQRARYLAMMEQ